MNANGGSNLEDREALVSEDIEATLILDAYLASAEAGHPLDPEVLLAKHPALADRLKILIAANTRIASIAGDVVPNFEDYRIVRELGRGGMGIVYEADQISRGRHVAIKVLTAAAAMDPQQLSRFRDVEVPAAQLLRHSHIVPITDFGRENGVYYYAMQFINGQNLAQLIKSVPKFCAAEITRDETSSAFVVARGDDAALQPQVEVWRPSSMPASDDWFKKVARWGLQVAGALDFAHQQGVVHRDIKPSNLLLDERDNVWITDFGLAQIQGEAHLTATGELTGTPRYMSPEQIQARTVVVDHRTDIYSLGVTLYELLALRRAFEGDNRQEVIRKVLEEEPARPRRLNRAIPRDLETIVLKAMAKERDDRYGAAQAMAEDLRRFLDRKLIQARRPSPLDQASRWARRHRMMVVSSAVLLFMGVAGLLVGIVFIASAERRARAAEALAMASARESRYESLLAQIQRLRLTPKASGWWDRVWALVREAALLRPGGNTVLEAEAGMTLAGLDARVIKRDPEPAASLAFDSQGKHLFMGGNRRLRVWDAATGRDEAHDLPADGPFAFRPDGRLWQLSLLPGDENVGAKLQLWSVLEQRMIRSFDAGGSDQATVVARALSIDGRFVAAISETPAAGMMLKVWEADSGRISFTTGLAANGLAFSPDAELLAARDDVGRITLWNMPRGEPIATLTTSKSPVKCLAYGRSRVRSDPGTGDEAWLLAAGDSGGTLTIWDLRTKSVVNRCRGSQYDVLAVAFSPDGSTLASAGRREAKLWDTATGELLLDLEPRNTMDVVAFSPDGKLLAVGSEPAFHDLKGGVDVYELSDGHGVRSLRGLRARVEKTAFSADGRFVACLSQDWWIAIWERPSGRLLHLIDAPHGDTADNAALAFSPDGLRIAFCAGREAKLWDVGTGKVLGAWPLPVGLGDSLAFYGPNCLLLVRVETRDGKAAPDSRFDRRLYPCVIRLRDLLRASSSGPLAVIEDFNWKVHRIDMSSDGRYFVAEGLSGPLGETRTVNAYVGPTGRKLWEFPSQRSLRASAWFVFDPSGEILALRTGNAANASLFAMPARVALGELDDCDMMCLGPSAKQWFSLSPFGPTNPVGDYFLYDHERAVALLRLVNDSLWAASQFSRDGRSVIWADSDGGVSLCELREVRERLAGAGLGR
jgi:serine/threonine protein kinase/WD40 repeat protein